MTADIKSIRARLANIHPFIGFGFVTSQITMETSDVEALCDEVEALREKLGRRRMHALYRATQYGRITGRSEMDAYGRSLGHALVKEIQERRKTAETSDDLAQGWYETEVDLHDALDREAELTADLYELRQQRREASEVWQ